MLILLNFAKKYLNLLAIATGIPSMLFACATKTNLTPGNERICLDGSVQQGQCILVSRRIFTPSNHAYQYIATSTTRNAAFAKTFGTALKSTNGEYSNPVTKNEFFSRLAPITLNANLDVPFALNNNLQNDSGSSYIDKINQKTYNQYASFQDGSVEKNTNILALLGTNITNATNLTHSPLDEPFDTDITSPQSSADNVNNIAKYINGSVSKSSDTLGLAFNSNFKTMTSMDISSLAGSTAFTVKHDAASNAPRVKFYPYYSIPTNATNQVDNSYKQYSIVGLGLKNFIGKIDKEATVLFAPSFSSSSGLMTSLNNLVKDKNNNLSGNLYFTTLSLPTTEMINVIQTAHTDTGLRRVAFTIDTSKTEDKMTIAESAMINRELITIVAKGFYDKYNSTENKNTITIIPTGTVASGNISTNFNVLYGQKGYYFVTDNAAENSTKSITANTTLGKNYIQSSTDTLLISSGTEENTGINVADASTFAGYIFGKYPFANMYYGSSYAQFGKAANSNNQGTNYDSKLAGMILEYSKLLGGDGYNNLKKNLLVAASIDFTSTTKDISLELPKITDGTRGCGAYRDFCISVPNAVNQDILADKSLAASATLAAVVDSARKIFLQTKAGQDYPYLSDFIKTKLTDKIDFENTNYITTSSSAPPKIDSNNANYTSNTPQVYQFNKIDDLKTFITSRGYDKVLEYYATTAKDYDITKDASGDYSKETDKTSAIYIGGNKNEVKVGESKIQLLQDKANLTSLLTDGKTFEAKNINDANVLTILKYLVADDIIFIANDGTKYINGERLFATAIIEGQKIYFNKDCSGIECKILAKDPSNTIQSNIYGYGILNSQEITTPATKSINIAGKSFALNDSLVQGSSVTGQNLDGSSRLQSIASNVDYTVTFKDSVYNYAADASAALKPITYSMEQISNLGSAMFFNQSQFNQNIVTRKNYNLGGFSFSINTSNINTSKSNPLANLASLNLSSNQSGLSRLNGGSFGSEVGKWHFRGFYNSQNNAKSLGLNDTTLQAVAPLSLGQFANGLQINNYSSVLGIGQKGFAAGYRIGNNLTLESSFAKTSNSLTTSFDGNARKQGNLISLGILKNSKSLDMGLSFGLINESNGFLGATTSGAFSLSSKTGFLTTLFKYNFTNGIFDSSFLRNVFVFYSGSFGATKVSSSGGILSGNGLIYSSAHLAGFGKKNIVTKNDSISLAINMPLTIDRGLLNATNGSESARINLARGIKARWISTELGYSVAKDIKTKTGVASVNFGINIAQANNYYNINGLKSRSAMLNTGFVW